MRLPQPTRSAILEEPPPGAFGATPVKGVFPLSLRGARPARDEAISPPRRDATSRHRRGPGPAAPNAVGRGRAPAACCLAGRGDCRATSRSSRDFARNNKNVTSLPLCQDSAPRKVEKRGSEPCLARTRTVCVTRRSLRLNWPVESVPLSLSVLLVLYVVWVLRLPLMRGGGSPCARG